MVTNPAPGSAPGGCFQVVANPAPGSAPGGCFQMVTNPAPGSASEAGPNAPKAHSSNLGVCFDGLFLTKISREK